jgi:hypothetical protein
LELAVAIYIGANAELVTIAAFSDNDRQSTSRLL